MEARRPYLRHRRREGRRRDAAHARDRRRARRLSAHRPRTVTAALAAACALWLSACGGHAATRADVIARGNAICSTAASAVRATPSPSGSSTDALAGYLKRVVPVIDREAASLRALPRPARGRAQLDGFITAEAKLAAAYGQLATAVRGGDQTAVSRALASLQSNDAPALAARYGLTQCTGSTATVR